MAIKQTATGHHFIVVRFRGILLSVIAAILISGCSRGPVELRLITPRLGFDQQIANELQRAFEGNSHIRLTLVPHADDDMSSLELLDAGVGELALISNSEAYRTGVETVIPLYPAVLHIAHREELEPKNGADLLVGTTVFAGPPGSPERIMLQQTASRLGVFTDQIRFVETATPRPDVIILFAPVMAGLMDDLRDYRLFSIGTVDQLGRGSPAESVSLLRPQFQPLVLPEDTYPDIVTEPVVTIAVDKLLVTRSDIPQAVVYDFISELLRLRPALSATNPGLFHKLSGDFDPSGSTFVIHPGAQAYLERDAPSTYERYSGIAEVAVTLLIGLVSGTYAAVRIYRIRRKNRIDEFYERAIAIRKSFRDNKDRTARANAVEEVRALQGTAFDLLVKEKLAADESFRIFITLCNDIIADLRA